MNILINIYQVQSGGGQQVASNFIKIISENNFGHKWFAYVGEGSELNRLAEKFLPSQQLLCRKYSYKKRLLQKRSVKNFVNHNQIDLVFNYGPVIPGLKKPQIVRSVYSNLYFPEVDFWNGYKGIDKLKKIIIDRFRLKGTLSADGLIFENKSMQKRAVDLYNYEKAKTYYVEPSVSIFDENETSAKYESLQKSKIYKILYLSSWYLNKKIDVLPQVAHILKKSGIQIRFILTLEKDDPEVNDKLIKKILKYDVEDYFQFINKVEAIHVHQVIKACDAMILLSKLECFSSNVIEAFYFKKPLIISNEEWSKSACGNAALFVNRDDPKAIAETVTNLKCNSILKDNLLRESQKRLSQFNTPVEKVSKQVDFIETIFENA